MAQAELTRHSSNVFCLKLKPNDPTDPINPSYPDPGQTEALQELHHLLEVTASLFFAATLIWC